MSQIYDKYKINKFEENFGYKFHNPELLGHALTHTSYANEYFQSTGTYISNNERLEFLGDVVMGAIVSTYLFEKFPDFPEGKLSKIRSCIVCESSLSDCFLKNNMSEFIMLGKGEEMTGGRVRPSILADCFEAIIGAVYIDGGFSAASEYVNKVMMQAINNGIKTYEITDAKTFLQEAVRKLGLYTPEYKIINMEGPDHNKIFTSRVSIIAEGSDTKTDQTDKNNKNDVTQLYAEGVGQSKKEAEQKAAFDFIDKWIN